MGNSGRATFASMFTGFGGADLGAMAAGFTPIWGVEFDPDIAACAAQNSIHSRVADVRDVDYSQLARPDLLHASPVCKNASIAKQNGGEAVEDIETAAAVIRAIVDLKPRAFTLENVRGYREFQAFKNILAALKAEGYAVAVDVLNSANYGVPQTRERLFIIARRDGKRPVFPNHTNAPADEISPLFDERKPWVGWYEAIADLIDGLEETDFADWQLKRMPSHLKNASRSRAFLATTNQVIREWTVRDEDDPAMTITASASSRPTATPLAGVNGRVVKMSPRCMARFQSFPDSYLLPSKASLAVRGIGNAVPPLLYQRIAEVLK